MKLKQLAERAVGLSLKMKKVCREECYRKDENYPPLFLPPLDSQNIILMSESPWDFPNYSKNIKDFILRELPEKLSKEKEGKVPTDIFSFIRKIFDPLFMEPNSGEEMTEVFLSNVYWTHMAKKSLKDKNKEKAVPKCLGVFLTELREEINHNVKLFVICTSYFPKLLLGASVSEILFEYQTEKIRKGELLTVGEILTLAKAKRYKETLELFKDSYISFFPNPSRRNAPLSKCFFTREDTKNLLNFIHNLLFHEIHL